MNIPCVTMSTKIKELGFDSLNYVKLIVDIETIFLIEYPDDKLTFDEYTEIDDVINTIILCQKLKFEG